MFIENEESSSSPSFIAVPLLKPVFATHILYTGMQIRGLEGSVGLPHLSFGALFKVVFPPLSSFLEIQHNTNAIILALCVYILTL